MRRIEKHMVPPMGIRDNPMALESYTAVLQKEGDGYVALCPEFDVASQGGTVEEALSNLREAVELFLECADPSEIAQRRLGEVYVTRLEVEHGTASGPVR